MTIYFVSLALGLFFIYSVRDMLLVLQNRRDAKAARAAALEHEQSMPNTNIAYIIQQNQAQCKRFERAS